MKKIKNILILAGGDSERFWPLRNKMLWPFLGKSLISHLITEMSYYGENIIIVTSRNNYEQLKDEVGSDCQLVVQDEKLVGMGGAVLSTLGKIKGSVLVTNASDIFNSDLMNQIVKKIAGGDQIILTAKKFADYFPGGYLQFKEGRLSAIVEKPGEKKRPSDLVKMVLDYFSDIELLFTAIKKTKTDKDNWYEQALSVLISQIKIDVVEYNDYLIFVKYPWHLLSVTSHFLKMIETNTIDKTAVFSKDAIIRPPVYIGKNVRIGDFAKIVGPVYIDDNTIIADHTLVYQSHIGKNCLIGGYSEVTRSYLGNGVMLHRNYVGDSVLADYVMMGAQAATANFRFDGLPIKDSGLIKFGSIIGTGSKIGVNATCLPGVRIGQKTYVCPGETISQDIKNNKFVSNNKISDNKK